jgi:hypothetical protein
VGVVNAIMLTLALLLGGGSDNTSNPCVEDEYFTHTVCVHVEGDGWRPTPPPPSEGWVLTAWP